MFDIGHDNGRAQRPDQLSELRDFACDNGDALVAAAEWLGGTRGAGRALDALDSLSDAHLAPRQVLALFEELLDLLMLEHVHDPHREEASFFAALNPWDARVEDVCLLADGLTDALAACREATEYDAAEAERRAAA
jgi:hypothetical protein